MNTDGNLAALRAYERQQDAIAEGDAHLESLQQALADDLFDAYLTENHDVIGEVDDFLADYPWPDRMRAAMTKECERPVMGRGCIAYKALETAISEACEHIAKVCTTPDEFDRFRREFGL